MTALHVPWGQLIHGCEAHEREDVIKSNRVESRGDLDELAGDTGAERLVLLVRENRLQVAHDILEGRAL